MFLCRKTLYRTGCNMILVAGLFAFFSPAQTTAAEKLNPLSSAQQMLSDLRAANEARTALETQRSEWSAEKTRLELLLQLLHDEKIRTQQEERRIQAEISKLRKESDGMTSVIDAYRTLQEVEKQVARRLQKALDLRRPSTFPGVLAAQAGGGELNGLLATALNRLESAEDATKTWSVEVVTGLLDGQELAVRLLRAGNAVAWWLSLDGSHAGGARMRDGQLLLVEYTDPAVRQQIQLAFAIQAGKMTPTWVLLPLTKDSFRQSAGVTTETELQQKETGK